MTQVLHSPLPSSPMHPIPYASPALTVTSPYSASSGVESGREDEVSVASVLDLLADVIRKSLISGCGSGGEDSWGMEIGNPTNVRHVAHVTFDKFDGFLGLPEELQPDVPSRPLSASASVFGVATESMQLSFDQGGNVVPTILLMMQRRLYELGGLQAEGIFRINGENGQEEFVREQLNHGTIPDKVDVHCLAGLIKAWFRELPTGILDSLSPEEVMQSQTKDQCLKLVRQLPPTESSLLDWALNLMADVAEMEHLNKMNAYNVAVVFAPNMTQMADPLTALMHAVQLTNFLKLLIEAKLVERREAFLESPAHIDSPRNDEPKIPTELIFTEDPSDCCIGLTEESRSEELCHHHTSAQSNKPHSERGSRVVNGKKLRKNVDRSSADSRINSRQRRFEAWR